MIATFTPTEIYRHARAAYEQARQGTDPKAKHKTRQAYLRALDVLREEERTRS